MSHETNPALDPAGTPGSAATAPWEMVHHISNYYDFPLEGLADFQRTVVVFFLHEEITRPDPEDPDDFTVETIYALYPVPEELVRDLTEKQAIFERWHQAYARDRTLMKQHPALPADRARFEQLQAKLRPELDALRQSPASLIRTGEFAGNRRPVEEGASRWCSFEVRWLE